MCGQNWSRVNASSPAPPGCQVALVDGGSNKLDILELLVITATLGDRARGKYAPGIAHYIFKLVKEDAARGSELREQAVGFMRLRMWGIGADERHRHGLAPGDLVLIYLGAPEREFIGRAELASATHDWTPSEAEAYPGDSTSGVLLAQVEEWTPAVALDTVVQRIDPTASQPLVQTNAATDFRGKGAVIGIDPNEYETALAVAAEHAIAMDS